MFRCLFGITLGIVASSWHWHESVRPDGDVDPVIFEDIATRSGVAFVLRNSAQGKKHIIEPMTGGVAVLDYNHDGKLDLYFVNGAQIPELEKTDASYNNRLYRNDGGGRFTDVTLAAGVPGVGYGMGVAVADYDNDGFSDIFLPGLNHRILYRNRGDGSFEDVTRKAGLQPGGSPRENPWSVAAGWLDYDSDGFLDLFVVNYLAWSPEKDRICPDPSAGYRIYCDPRYFQGLPNILYHNNGDGTFTDVSTRSGIGSHLGKGMSVAFADYDQDGQTDIFVSNDTVPNSLFRNEGGGRFREVALEAGVAVNDNGRSVSSMGVDFRDYDNDGREDLFVTALANETFPLFRNLGKGLFKDYTYESRVASLTITRTGWSNAIFDFNNDGFKDLFAASGDVQDNAEVFSSRKSKQMSCILLNRKNGTFEDFSQRAGASFRQVGLHRGAAFGDFDGDGRMDLIVSRLNDQAELFRNVSPAANHWLALKLVGRVSNRDAVGARVKITDASGRQQWNHVTTSVGYASSSAQLVHFGIGKESSIRRVDIQWPSGRRQTLENVKADQSLKVEEP